MKLLKQVGDTCMLYSVAMLFDITPEVVIKELGHDGSEIWWPCNAYHPDMSRSYHIQEIQDMCIGRGYALANIEVWPVMGPRMKEFREAFEGQSDDKTIERFFNHIKGHKGILILRQNDSELEHAPTHACAWDGENIYDPNGKVYPPEDLESGYKDDWNIQEAYILTKMI